MISVMANSFRDIIGLWPSPDALAAELGAKADTVRKWRQRDSIPAEWWMPLIEAAKARSVALSAAEMATLAVRREPAAPAVGRAVA